MLCYGAVIVIHSSWRILLNFEHNDHWLWNVLRVYKLFIFQPILMQFFSMTWLCLAAKSFQKYDEGIPLPLTVSQIKLSEKGFQNLNFLIFHANLMHCFAKWLSLWFIDEQQDKCPKYIGSTISLVLTHYCIQHFSVSSKILCPHLLLIYTC
jgi:hypothetical protein